jgi:hypothetical protein
MAGLDKVDPVILCLDGVLRSRVGKPAPNGRTSLRLYRQAPARELNEGISVVEDGALHRRTGVVGKVCVLTS